ncbi:MAG: Zn-dependent alcohol dehydrogenase [Phycisphaeraceae bacterium]|nr:Zn-dependent alcohol dehydrogenase [Phycisphaeraceae bacterium]
MSDTAVVTYAAKPGCVELRDIPEAVIRDDEVLLEVRAVGVCGSDLHMWKALHSWPMNYPVVLGHEFGGVIADVGAQVRGWSAGDRVVSETHAIIDPDSPLTRKGLYNLDPARQGYGAAVDGAMRRLVPVPARILHRIPDNVTFEKAALTEPCCVAYNAVVGNSSIEPGDRVVVLGPGPIGILCAMMARLRGAEVAVFGLAADAPRLEVASRLGCTALTDHLEDWAKQWDGLGVEGVVDAAGVSSTLEQALEIVRPAGWITKVGWGRDPLGFSLDPLVQKNVRLQGSFSHNWPIWERVLALLSSGSLDLDPIIGGTWPLEQWHDAFETMHSCTIVKAVLQPTSA